VTETKPLVKYVVQVNEGELQEFDDPIDYEQALLAAKGAGWVREWQDHGDGQKRFYKRIWR